MASTGATQPPHLLYVAWGFPPCRGSGVYRAWATANAFAEQGWKVTVLTVPRETFTLSTGVDESLERTVDPRIEIVRVPFQAAAFENDLRQWSRMRASSPELWNTLNARREQRSFPERTYGPWKPALENAALAVHARTPVDIVLGSGNPHVDFIPGHVLHAQHGVPYVMDYRDAWQLDVFSGARTHRASSPVARWERKLIENAHSVWFVNEAILRWHAGLYPEAAERFRVVANGYDAAPETEPRHKGEAPLTFGYVGTLTRAVPIAQLVEGWRLARERSATAASATMEIWGHLDHSGTPNETISRQLAGFPELGISYRGPVPKKEIGAVYARFDALLLALGTGKYVTSGKVFEYAATGLPIVSVHDPGNAASDVLRGYPAWHPVTALTPEAIAEALVQAADAASNQQPRDQDTARRWAQRFQRRKQLDPRIAELQEVVEMQRARS
ncbi:glycosyltransferase [Microbacterium sp. NPDC077486]|uniref:glycosyltransferase family protein n=1 Tax=Microbacterium sp. NPDC077486 TaxID=3154766 RepID=UPI0034385C6D